MASTTPGAVLALPAPYRKRLRTTNLVERTIEEIRRRERIIRIFPDRASVIRLLGALLICNPPRVEEF